LSDYFLYICGVQPIYTLWESFYLKRHLSHRRIVSTSSKDTNQFSTYPLHRHTEFELNFIQYGKGAKRIVGNSIEEIGDYELVLIASPNLEHAWEQGNCTSKDIKEITIQFAPDLFDEKTLARNQFVPIRKMLEDAKSGLAFETDAIIKAYNTICAIPNESDSFIQMLRGLWLLNILSKSNYKILSNNSTIEVQQSEAQKKENFVKDYLHRHFKEEISLAEVAKMVGMSQSSFSRFFKHKTGDTLSDYLIEIRLGQAARYLIDTTMNISEICYSCGFNNLSNFNRIFKAKRGMTPKEFRYKYKKNKQIV